MKAAFIFFLFLGQITFSQTKTDKMIDSLSLSLPEKQKAEIALRISDELKNRDWTRAQHYIEYSEDIAKQINSDEFTASVNYEIGDIYNEKDLFDIALSYFIKAYDYYDETENESEKHRLENSLAIIYARLNNSERAKYHFKNVLVYYTSTKQPVYIAKALNNIGKIYFSEKETDSAMVYFQKSLKLSEKLNETQLDIILYNNIGLCYAAQDNFSEALSYFNKSKKVALEANNTGNLPWIYNSISKLYLSEKQADSALYYSTKAAGLLNSRKNSFENLDALENIYKSYVMKEDFANAAKYFQSFSNLRDSLNIEIKAMNVEKMKLEQQYKENEELRKLKENKKQFTYLLFGLVLIILILILAILLTRYRNKLTKTQLEKDLFESKKKELDANLELKNKELMTHSMMEIQRVEATEHVLDELKQLRLQTPKKETQQVIDTIIKQLKKDNNEDEVWKEFELSYGQVYEDFYNILNEKHPELTPRDKRLCALLKLNLTTKEISRITGQSVKSLENARTRLRKKLNLTNTNENLTTYLSKLE